MVNLLCVCGLGFVFFVLTLKRDYYRVQFSLVRACVRACVSVCVLSAFEVCMGKKHMYMCTVNYTWRSVPP